MFSKLDNYLLIEIETIAIHKLERVEQRKTETELTGARLRKLMVCLYFLFIFFFLYFLYISLWILIAVQYAKGRVPFHCCCEETAN